MTVEIRHLHRLSEMEELLVVAERVWGIAPGGLVGPDFLMALAHADGYVVGAFDDARMVGASFGVLGRHDSHWCLHSHITGVIPELQNSGLGRRMKQHQRRWAIERDLASITWTFDPLVRRNGWFNLHALGAQAVEYHVNFYGPLRDAINGDDDSDRLLARWDVRSPRALAAEKLTIPPAVPAPDDVVVDTPDDIVALRRSDSDRAWAWRREMRESLVPLLATHFVRDMTESGQYVLAPRPSEVNR
ncbi:MAG: GNAT family N-acetyltransferase [Actinomycetota bacterium]